MFMVLSDTKTFEYTLTVTKKEEAGVTFESFKEESFTKSYLESCNCTIESQQEQQYGELKTYQLTTITKANGQTLYGVVDNVERNGDVYVFAYLTTLANYEKFKSSYREVLESLDFKE